MDAKHVYDLDDLKKFKESGASVEEVHKAYAMMAENKERREKTTMELINSDWKTVSLDRVRDLVEQDADVNAKDKNGNTLLHRVSMYGYIDIVTYFKEMEKLSLQRSQKAKEIRSVDGGRAGQPVDHSLRRMLFGGNQLRRNAPLSPAVAARLKKRQDRS